MSRESSSGWYLIQKPEHQHDPNWPVHLDPPQFVSFGRVTRGAGDETSAQQGVATVAHRHTNRGAGGLGAWPSILIYFCNELITSKIFGPSN